MPSFASFRSAVASVRRLSPGDGVSYGLTFRAERPTLAATVPVGYAEGYPRQLSGRAEALMRGKRRPLLGRVTMDACVFEADEGVDVGDEVVLLGEQGGERIFAEELAKLAGTINYAFTTGVDPRFGPAPPRRRASNKLAARSGVAQRLGLGRSPDRAAASTAPWACGFRSSVCLKESCRVSR